NLTVTKNQESATSFGVEVNLDGVECDICQRDDEKKIVLDNSDPLNPQPKRQPGKVDGYRFMTFYLEPRSEYFDEFFNKVIDPIWIAQSGEPNAAALRQAQQGNKRPPCWRVLHRVTFVSRVLEEFGSPTATPLEKDMRAADIESNYELIQKLAPFVRNKAGSYVEFAAAIRAAVTTYLPELQSHMTDIIRYMCLYFEVPEGV
ncbi:MAG: hypothetical protein M3347_13110, partial [Armatimonadota bacterium]|nr:hypothetical protein [Armatimonadota bacterium]